MGIKIGLVLIDIRYLIAEIKRMMVEITFAITYLKEFLNKIMAPEMTPVSYPNRNPPRAAKKVKTKINVGVCVREVRSSIFKCKSIFSSSELSPVSFLGLGVVCPFRLPVLAPGAILKLFQCTK